MGDVRPNGGGNGIPPDDGGLPGFPPEWGAVVIPDDPAELAEESHAVRRELRRERRHNLVRRLFGLPPVRLSRGESSPNLGIPLVIMAVAVLTTLVSLFIVTWDHQPSAPPLPPVVTTAATSASVSPNASSLGLADLTFTDATGRTVRLGTLLPAVIVLVDSCACTDLVIDIAESAAASKVSLIAVDRHAPTLSGAPANTHALADPDGILRKRYLGDASPVPGKPSALIVAKTGTVTQTLPAVSAVSELRTPLAHAFGS